MHNFIFAYTRVLFSFFICVTEYFRSGVPPEEPHMIAAFGQSGQSMLQFMFSIIFVANTRYLILVVAHGFCRC